MYDDSYYGVVLIIYLIAFAIAILCCIAQWRIFRKAGYHGWEIFVPIYGSFVLNDIIFGNAMYTFIYLIPVVGLIFAIYSIFMLAKVFGKSDLWGLGMVFFSPIFLIMLAFDGNAYYCGPAKGNMYLFGSYNGGADSYGGYGAGSYGAVRHGAGSYGAGSYGAGGYGAGGYQQDEFFNSGSQTYQSNPFQNNGFQAQGQGYQSNRNPFEQQNQSAQSNPFTQQGGNYSNPYDAQQNNSNREW